jgi:hypothetical protein
MIGPGGAPAGRFRDTVASRWPTTYPIPSPSSSTPIPSTAAIPVPFDRGAAGITVGALLEAANRAPHAQQHQSSTGLCSPHWLQILREIGIMPLPCPGAHRIGPRALRRS